jgi:hypothetical protein
LIWINDFRQPEPKVFLSRSAGGRAVQTVLHTYKKTIQIKAKPDVGRQAKKPLGVRYAELLRLRQTVLETQSAKPTRVNHLDLR